MPHLIIITHYHAFDAELHHSGLALFRKLTAEGNTVTWIDVRTRGSEDQRYELHFVTPAPSDPSVLAGTSVYAISHGTSPNFNGMKGKVLADNFEQFLAALKVPTTAPLEKLCLISCGSGGTHNDTEPPMHIAIFVAALSTYSVKRVLAWNSFVSLFSYRQLTDMFKTRQKELLAQAQLDMALLGSAAEALKRDLMASIISKVKVTSLTGDHREKLAAAIKSATKEQLLALLGKRFVQGRVYKPPETAASTGAGSAATATALTATASNTFDTKSSPSMAQRYETKMSGYHFSYTGDTKFGFGLAQDTFVVLDHSTRVAMIAQALLRKEDAINTFCEDIMKVILDYAGMWVYFPDKQMFCLLDTEGAKLLALK